MKNWTLLLQLLYLWSLAIIIGKLLKIKKPYKIRLYLVSSISTLFTIAYHIAKPFQNPPLDPSNHQTINIRFWEWAIFCAIICIIAIATKKILPILKDRVLLFVILIMQISSILSWESVRGSPDRGLFFSCSVVIGIFVYYTFLYNRTTEQNRLDRRR